MGDEFGGLGNVLLFFVVFLTVGSTALIWLTGFALRRASERRRRQFTGEEPLPSIFSQATNWVSQEDNPMEDNQGHDPDMLPPDLEALIFGGDTPAPDVEEEVREGEVVPPKSAPVSDVSAVRTQVIPDIDELPEDATEVLRVYRDLNDGKLIFEMKGKLFAASQHIEDSPLANRFSAIVDEMVKIDAGLRRRPATSQVPPPPQRPVPPPPSQSRAPVDEDAPEPTIGDQIQDFLQHRLAAHPEFAGRRINIRPSLHGSITIEVDGHFYDAVADIPDASVRDFLQQTIQDWSDRH